jgi:uncharacterized protein YjeT (DUF2065 family)
LYNALFPILAGGAMKRLLLLCGLLSIVEGLRDLTVPEKKKKWLTEVARLDNGKLRLIGLISVAVGFLILLVARQGGWLG